MTSKDRPTLNSDPAYGAVSITAGASPIKADSYPTRGIYCAAAGNATFTWADGNSVAINGMLAGVVYPFRVTHCTAATATLVALY